MILELPPNHDRSISAGLGGRQALEITYIAREAVSFCSGDDAIHHRKFLNHAFHAVVKTVA
jgi:hypothetical protein